MRLAFVMKAKRVVLLSDGLGNIGGNAAAVLRGAREAMLGGVRIDTIGLGVNQDAALLDILARESGGLYQALRRSRRSTRRAAVQLVETLLRQRRTA